MDENPSIFVQSMRNQSTNKVEHKQKTQLERANAELIKIAPAVTTSDRQEAKLTYSEFTIVQYLNGRGKNLDTAMTLLTFFRKKIEDREKALS
jgi:hypothetical protein